MTFTKSLLTAVSALTLAAGATFAGEDSTHDWPSNESMPLSSLETSDAAYFEQSAPTMTDPMTLSSTGATMESADVYYIVPMEVVEVEEIWLVPHG